MKGEDPFHADSLRYFSYGERFVDAPSAATEAYTFERLESHLVALPHLNHYTDNIPGPKVRKVAKSFSRYLCYSLHNSYTPSNGNRPIPIPFRGDPIDPGAVLW